MTYGKIVESKRLIKNNIINISKNINNNIIE